MSEDAPGGGGPDDFPDSPAFPGLVAVLDACVLYPASLRDLFVTLAENALPFASDLTGVSAAGCGR